MEQSVREKLGVSADNDANRYAGQADLLEAAIKKQESDTRAGG